MSFKVFGIKIVLTKALFVWFAILCALFSWKTGDWIDASIVMLALLGIVYTIVVLHELGHSLAAKKLGYNVQSILLLPFGGLAIIGKGKNNDWRKNHLHEFWITICGPLVNIFILMLLAPLVHLENTIVDFVCYLNWILLAFNLIPIYPMDGGRLMRCFLTWYFGGDYKRSTKWAQHITLVVLMAAIPVFICLGWWMAIVVVPLVVLLGFVESQQLDRPTTKKELKVFVDGVEVDLQKGLRVMREELEKLDLNDPHNKQYVDLLQQGIQDVERTIHNVRCST